MSSLGIVAGIVSVSKNGKVSCLIFRISGRMLRQPESNYPIFPTVSPRDTWAERSDGAVLAFYPPLSFYTIHTSIHYSKMFEFIITLILAMLIMVILSCIGVLITQPIHGALVRLRANYSPKAVSLDGLDNR
jgi:hypothetical protein